MSDRRVEELLDDVWHGISTGDNLTYHVYAPGPPEVFASGVLHALKSLGLITMIESAGWVAMFKECPEKEAGHPGRGNGGWCAYCGSVYNDADLEDAGNLALVSEFGPDSTG